MEQMIDRTKVIKELKEAEYVITKFVPERYWGYSRLACWDAIDLLKAQEPVEQEPVEATILYYRWNAWYLVCGACYREVDKGDTYCRWCGRKIKKFGRRKELDDGQIS